MVEEGAEFAKRCDACSEITSKPNDNSSAGALNAEKPKRSVDSSFIKCGLLLGFLNTNSRLT